MTSLQPGDAYLHGWDGAHLWDPPDGRDRGVWAAELREHIRAHHREDAYRLVLEGRHHGDPGE